MKSICRSGDARRIWRAVALGTLAVVLVACSSVPSVSRKSRINDFDTAVESYAKMLRWGYYEEATGYLRKPDGTPIEADLTRIARYRVSGYTNTTKLIADTSLEGRVVAQIEYYEIDTGTLHKLRDEQLWWYDETSKHWYLNSPLPAFGLVAK